MITLNTQVVITRKNPVLKVDVSNTVPEGEYEVLIVLEEKQKSKKQPLSFSNHKVVIAPDQRFCREELYGDDGR